ncbi:hypothetical protein PVK06_009610 [Gossypium arboreum]|uniref:Uncharacterized protein n=1 Tax=Gossypium arboreum TaxID=29729 RepID=A0ABR0QP68_GOSAR|nr:hypothetical protein PVK06_009610 [Gossypium arboreum]
MDCRRDHQRGDLERQTWGVDHWLCRQFGKCSIFDAELWGILDSLSLVQEEQGNGAIEAIQVSESTPSKSTLIRRIHHFLKNVGNWALEYIPREENVEAD